MDTESSIYNLSEHIQNLDQLETFLRNVSLEIQNKDRKFVFSQIASQMNKSFQSHNLKVTNLWFGFVSRMDASNFGVTNVHVHLLHFLIKQKLYKQALKLVSTLRLPLTISLNKYRHYLLLEAEVFIQFQHYDQAVQSLYLACSIQDRRIESQFLPLKMLVLTINIIKRHLKKRDFIDHVQRFKLICLLEIEDWKKQQPEKLKQFQFQVQLFAKICQNQLLQEPDLKHLKEKDFLELYLKSKNRKFKQIRQYIQKEIYNPVLYRIKCTEIKDQEISSFTTIRDVNFPTKIYKYDMKNSIMYFEHSKMSQQQLDQQIDKICEMQQVIRKKSLLKSQSIEKDQYGRDEMEQQRRPSFGGFFGRMVGNIVLK